MGSICSRPFEEVDTEETYVESPTSSDEKEEAPLPKLSEAQAVLREAKQTLEKVQQLLEKVQSTHSECKQITAVTESTKRVAKKTP